MLTKNAVKTATFFPMVLGVGYLLPFLTVKSIIPMIIMVLLWGILFAIGNMISQFPITSTAPEAPDFANGLFLGW